MLNPDAKLNPKLFDENVEQKPIRDGWQNLFLDAEDVSREFSDGRNVGLLLGKPSGGLADVDLDCEQALGLASAFLPGHGRNFRAQKRTPIPSALPGDAHGLSDHAVFRSE